MSDYQETSDEIREIMFCEEKEDAKNKYELSDSLKAKLGDMPEVLEFINLLQLYIEKQKRKLRKIKLKLKKVSFLKHVEVQTDICESNGSNQFVYTSETTLPSKSIAEDIKDAAEEAIQNSGFVYEETSGMYYDYNTGYYYNAEYGLYYDGNSGTYLSYNQDTKSYEYHSQVSTVSSKKRTEIQNERSKQLKSKVRMKRKNNIEDKTKASKRHHLEQREDIMDLEEGECSYSSSGESSQDYEDVNSDSSDASKQWPPCMRIIVEESSIPKVKVGSLHIITFEGGSIGREGDHAILIPDINISKHHLNVSFDKDSAKYQATDMGSRNGTLLNGKRMSPSKQESEPTEVVHGSRIQLGATLLLCHIHEGNQTCGHCEPGLIEQQGEKLGKITKTTKIESHKKELKNLRKKFGMSNYDEDNPKLATGYTDRAQKRRDTVGSQNPHEKTQTASVEESIPSENKGFKLLSKMGWKEGESLGKDGQGMLEPINLVTNQGKAGIGSDAPVINPVVESKGNSKLTKKRIWRKTQERFEKLPNKNTTFEESD